MTVVFVQRAVVFLIAAERAVAGELVVVVVLVLVLALGLGLVVDIGAVVEVVVLVVVGILGKVVVEAEEGIERRRIVVGVVVAVVRSIVVRIDCTREVGCS